MSAEGRLHTAIGGPLFRRGAVPAALLVALLAVAVYTPTLGNGFVYDDDYIFKHPQIVDGATPRDAGWVFTTAPDGNWMPLTWISHLLAVAFFGLKPAGHHAIQILIHATNTALLFLVLRRTTGDALRSFAVSLLFAIHPLHVESVAWIAERKDVLSTLFGILSVNAYVGYARRPGGGRYLAALGWLAASLMAKPMLVTLPLVFLLLDWWPLNRIAASRVAARGAEVANLGRACSIRWLLAEKVPFFAVAAAAGLIAVSAQRLIGAVGAEVLYPPGVRVANALNAVAAYLGDLVVPIGLAAFYPHPGDSLSRADAAVTGLAMVTATVLFALVRRTQPSLLFGWVWFILTLLPVAGLLQVGEQARADRYTYVPFLGLYILLVWGLAGAASNRPAARRVLLVAAGTAAVILVSLTVRQQGFWKDNVSLFRHAVTVTRGNWVAHYNLGIALAGQARMEESRYHLGEAVRLQPGIPRYRYDLARVLALSGHYVEAEVEYRQALALAPGDAEVHRDLGAVIKALGRPEEAERELMEALRLAPLDVRAQRHLADLRAGISSAQAKELHERALAVDPGDWRAHAALGRLLLEAGDAEGGERHYREALRANPGVSAVHYDLALVLDRRGAYAEAVDHYAFVVKARPDYAEARNNLGVDLEELGRLDEAELQYREAVRLSPRSVSAVYNLGLLLGRRGKGREAGDLFRRALLENQESAELHHGLGRVLGLAGDLAAAVREFETALALQPGFGQARRDLDAIRGAAPRELPGPGAERK